MIPGLSRPDALRSEVYRVRGECSHASLLPWGLRILLWLGVRVAPQAGQLGLDSVHLGGLPLSVSEEPRGSRGPCGPHVGADLVWVAGPSVPLCVVPLELGLHGVGRGDGCWGRRLAGSRGSSSLCGPKLSGGALLCLPGDRPMPVERVLRLRVLPAVWLGTCAQARAPAQRLLLSPGSEGSHVGGLAGPARRGRSGARAPPAASPRLGRLLSVDRGHVVSGRECGRSSTATSVVHTCFSAPLAVGVVQPTERGGFRKLPSHSFTVYSCLCLLHILAFYFLNAVTRSLGVGWRGRAGRSGSNPPP